MRIHWGTLMLGTGLLAGCGHAGSAAPPAAQEAIASAGSVRAQTDTHATAALDGAQTRDADMPQADPQLSPLSADDIALYLQVMRAAADRVRHPTAQDTDALGKQKAFTDASTASASTNPSQEAAMDAAAAKTQAAIDAAMQSGDYARVKALAAQERAQMQALGSRLKPVAPPDPAIMNLALTLSNGEADREIVAERRLDSPRYERITSAIEEILVPPGTGVADCGGSDCGFKPSAEELRRQQAHQARVARNRKILEPYATEIRSLQGVVRRGKV